MKKKSITTLKDKRNRRNTMADKNKNLSLNGTLKILAADGEYRRKVELWLLNDAVNRNGWLYENLDQHKRLFADTPILVAYVGNKIGDGHNFDEVPTADGSTESFMSATAERIVGYFRDESDIRIVEKDGKKWIVGIGYLWEWYARELVAKLERQGLEGMSVSIETLINEMHTDGNVEVYTDYTVLGTTILGDDVQPAVAGANIKMLAALGAEKVKEMTLRVASKAESKHKIQSANKIQHKGVMTKGMRINEIQALLPDYTVVGVGEKHAALLSAKGMPCLCNFAKDETGLVLGAKVEVGATAAFEADGESVSVPVEAIAERFNSVIDELTEQLEAEKRGREAAETALHTMQKNEHERRKEAIKERVRKRFEELKADSGVELDESICASLLTEEKVEEYAEMEDKNGKFVGDIAACRDLDAECMSAVLKGNKVKANAAKARYAWELGADEKNNNESGVFGAMERLNAAKI